MSQMLPDSQRNHAPSSVDLSQVISHIAAPLQSVNEMLEAEVLTCEELLRDRLVDSGLLSGKRIRPALLLLSGACFGDLKNPHVAAAAALEFVHTATLVHDDVLDHAEHRRHRKSLNAIWNNTTSILTGDFLFSKAFDVGCQAGSLEVMRRIADASCKVCQGEITQNAMIGNYDINEEQYLEMISLKTAELCKCACGLGSLLSECDSKTVAAFEKYGCDIGVAFQIIDDVLDIVGKPDRVGKTLGTDLANKKATLPLIHCLQQLESSSRTELINQISNPELELAEVVGRLNETGSIEYARIAARDRAKNAYLFADALPSTTYSKSLAGLAEFVIERTY